MAVALLAGLTLWTVLCVAMAWRYPRRVAGSGGPPWREEFERAFASASSDAGRIAVANDALAEVEHELDVASRWPSTAARLSMQGWLMAVLAGIIWSRDPVLLGVVPLGAMALMGAAGAKRHGRRLAQARRERADRAVREVAGELAQREVAMPTRRQRRARRRRR